MFALFVCHIRARFHVFSVILAVFTSSSAPIFFPNFRFHSPVTLELEIYLFLGIVSMC